MTIRSKNSAHKKLARVEKEFVRIGLLLQHDRELASVTTIVAGPPIRGSWWGHPLGHELFDLLNEFEKGEGALSGKWVNGKITYVHRRLWPAFLTLVLHGERARSRGLSTAADSLLGVVRRREIVRVDEFAASCRGGEGFRNCHLAPIAPGPLGRRLSAAHRRPREGGRSTRRTRSLDRI